MDNVLKQIKQGHFKGLPKEKKKDTRIIQKEIERKKNWYKIGKVICQGHKVQLTKRSIFAAKRTYLYYKINKGNWTGPSARKFSFMRLEEFNLHLNSRSEQTSLDMTLDEALTCWDMQEDEINGVILN
jgi:hypothetical protein